MFTGHFVIWRYNLSQFDQEICKRFGNLLAKPNGSTVSYLVSLQQSILRGFPWNLSHVSSAPEVRNVFGDCMVLIRAGHPILKHHNTYRLTVFLAFVDKTNPPNPNWMESYSIYHLFRSRSHGFISGSCFLLVFAELLITSTCLWQVRKLSPNLAASYRLGRCIPNAAMLLCAFWLWGSCLVHNCIHRFKCKFIYEKGQCTINAQFPTKKHGVANMVGLLPNDLTCCPFAHWR